MQMFFFMKGKNAGKGFTLIEMVIAVTIMAILASITIPQLPDLLANYRLRRSVREMMTQLNRMKLLAIKENSRTVILFDEANDTYTIFLDNNMENWQLDNAENGVVTDLGEQGLEVSTNLVSDYTGFNGRGFQDRAIGGTITVTASNGNSQSIIISSIGTFRVN